MQLFKLKSLTFIQKLLTGSKRTVVIKKNVLGSFAIKALSILITLVLVPLTVNILDNEKYGIWITIFSIINWFNVMDMGLGNGFRNKFAEAIAHDNIKLAKEYLQTFYSSMILISGGIVVLYFAIYTFLNWQYILNIPQDFDENIDLIIGIVFVLFCGQLVLKNISTVLLSLQKTSLSNSLNLFGNILALVLIIILDELDKANLLTIAITFMVSPIIVYIIATKIIFNNFLKEFKINFFTIPKYLYIKDLVNLGIKFFIINITTIVMFSSSSIIITQLYGPAQVTIYSLANQLFFGFFTIFSIITTPFWTAFTEANAKKDFEWIKKSLKKLIVLWSIFTVGIILVWLISPFIFRIWLGDKILIPTDLSFQFALFVILMSWTTIFSMFLAGISKITISLYGAIFQCIVNIPLAIFLAKYMDLNITGVIMATNLNMFLGVVLLTWQTNKILNNRAYGIWNR